MRTSRLVAGLVTAGLVGLAPVALSAPANAATLPTTASLTVSPPLAKKATAFSYGDALRFSGAVTGSDGSTPSGGTATLQVSTPAVPTFTTVSTDTSPGYLYFPDVTAQSKAVYKVVFSGYSSSTNTYNPTESAPLTVAVSRAIKPKTKGLTVSAKVSPDYPRGKVKILRKDGKKFKKYATVKTNKKSRFSFRAPNRRGFKFVVVIPGDATFSPVYAGFTVL